MSRRILLLASLLFAPTLTAQDVPGITRIPALGKPQYVLYDLETHTSQRSDQPFPGQPQALGSGACYANSVDNDVVADALLFPAGDELFDWGIKTCGGSGFVDRIEIGMASMAPQGFNGALTLRIYQNAHGFNIPGQELLAMNLTGLPSDGPTTPGSSLIPYSVMIDLGNQAFFLPDGPIGWSYENPDGLTAPLLRDVTIELGTQNFFDVYRPGPASAGNYLGTFNLPPGGASDDPFENTFHIEISENDVPGTSTVISGVGNPSNMLSLGPPLLGSGWGARFNLAAFPDVTSTFVFVSYSRLFGFQTPFGELIADPAFLATPISVQTGNTHALPIPIQASLLGNVYYGQGCFLSTSQGLRLTNGFELTVGTL